MPGAYIFQRPFLRGLFLEGLTYGGKFAFQNRFGLALKLEGNLRFCLFYFVFKGNFKVQDPRGGGLKFEEAI